MHRHLVPAFLLFSLALAPALASAQRAEFTDVKVTSIGPKIAQLDSATIWHKATKKCGSAFRCKQGWDIAVLELKVAPVIVIGEQTYVRALVMNLGSVESPEVPAQTSLGETSKRWTVPAMAANDSVEVSVPLTPTTSVYSVKVALDPDAVSGDTYSDNNRKEADVKTEGRANLEFGEFRALDQVVKLGQALRVSVTIRNKSRAAAFRNGTIRVNADQAGSLISAGGTQRISCPIIGPQEELTAVITLRGVTDTANRAFNDALVKLTAEMWYVDESRGTYQSTDYLKVVK